MAWQPILAVENSQQMRQTGAAIESFRNEVVKENEKNLLLFNSKENDTVKVIPQDVD